MYKRFLVLKSAIYSFSHIQIQQIWSASALYVWKTHELSAGCAVSHARPSAASFLKVQLLIRSVLLLIVQGPGWPCLPETISGFCFLFFWKSGWSCNMIRISWSLRTMSHRSRQTGIAKGISLPPLHAQSLCFYKDFFLSSLCFLMHTLTNTWGGFSAQLCFLPTHQPTPLTCFGHQSAFLLFCRCDRGAVRASQSEALMLNQSDRATGRNAPNKQQVRLPCPFTSSAVIPKCWQSGKKYKYP